MKEMIVMRRTLMILFGILLTVSGVDAQNWTLVWADEFEGDARNFLDFDPQDLAHAVGWIDHEIARAIV